MKKRNGFTLIELLAVIVILAIIALIATPMVLKYIEVSKKKSFENSVYSIEKAAELKIMEMENDSDIKYPIELDVQDLDLKNKKDLIGTVTITKDNQNNLVYTYEVTNGDYNFIGNLSSEAYKVDKSVKLVFKTENGIIDDKNNYVYSFYTDTPDIWENYVNLNLDDYIGVENGNIEFQVNKDYETYSTGAKILLKDKNNKLMKSYTVIIFGDINGDGYIDANDWSELDWYLQKPDVASQRLKKHQLFAFDMNLDNKIDEEDYTILENYVSYICFYNNITHECVPLE